MFFYVIYRKSDFKILGVFMCEEDCEFCFNLLSDHSDFDWKAINYSVISDFFKEHH